MGFLYQAELRKNLTETLGVEWEPVQRGVAEISGVGDDVMVHFSRRSVEIRSSSRGPRQAARRGARELRERGRRRQRVERVRRGKARHGAAAWEHLQAAGGGVPVPVQTERSSSVT